MQGSGGGEASLEEQWGARPPSATHCKHASALCGSVSMWISHGVQSMHAWCLWESTEMFWGPKQPYTANIVQARVLAGASSLCTSPWDLPCRWSHWTAGSAQAPSPVCPAPGSTHLQKTFCSWGFVCGWRRARVQVEQLRRGDQRLRKARGNQPGLAELKREDQSPGASGGRLD